MCRLTIYKGASILLGDLIVKPDNSILCQSRDAAYHPGVDDKGDVRNIRVNGDGCGVGFYGTNPREGACMFKFVTPAWSNRNLRNLGEYVHSSLILAHVRAASSGHDPHEQTAVSIENCHPFKYRHWSFMHNGCIPSFRKIKRPLLNLLSEECFQDISGSTDSEHIFALFLNLLGDRDALSEVEEIVAAIQHTISIIVKLCQNAGIEDACSLNLCITDGIHIVATRFRNSEDPPPSLYYNYGSNFDCKEGRFMATDSATTCDIVISSAPLSKEEFSPEEQDPEHSSASWTLIPANHMLVCTGDANDISKVVCVSLKMIDIHVPEEASAVDAATESLINTLKTCNGLSGLGSDLLLASTLQSLKVRKRRGGASPTENEGANRISSSVVAYTLCQQCKQLIPNYGKASAVAVDFSPLTWSDSESLDCIQRLTAESFGDKLLLESDAEQTDRDDEASSLSSHSLSPQFCASTNEC